MADPRGPDGTVESATWLRRGRSFRAPLLLAQFPSEVPFGFLGRILPTTETVELTAELHRVDVARALEMIQGARAVASAELLGRDGGAQTPEYEVEQESAELFGREVARRTQDLWKVGVRLVALGPSRPRCEALRLRLSERLAALGFRVRVPRYEVSAALAPPDLSGSEPRPRGYWHTLPTDGVAALFPFIDESIVEPGGVLVGLALSDASPVLLNRWAHSSYSWGIFGTTGAGKTFATALLALRTRWMRPEVEITVLDPLGEFGGFVRSLGGFVVRLADGTGGRLNPLDPVSTSGNRREKAGRVAATIRALFPSIADSESAVLDTAASRLFERGPEVPTLDDLIHEIEREAPPSDRLRSLLDVFRSGSLRGSNGPTTVPDGPGPISVDFRGVPAEQLAFHLSYVLDWAYGRLRGRAGPKLLIVDEAHLLMRHPSTAEFLDSIVRHVRHFEAGVLLVSQTPEDFLGRAEGRAVLRNLYAVGLLRLPEVSREAREFFGLTSAEGEWLPRARLPAETGYAESLWRIGELHLPLAIVASTPEYEFLTGTLSNRPDGPESASPTGPL
ncbi:MAG TPA: DUF87 domain-containing protein [Thermoplasmata archaeon]|nr:DUF87 domain-containing protein [Thermoplasmata archaeon]